MEALGRIQEMANESFREIVATGNAPSGCAAAVNGARGLIEEKVTAAIAGHCMAGLKDVPGGRNAAAELVWLRHQEIVRRLVDAEERAHNAREVPEVSDDVHDAYGIAISLLVCAKDAKVLIGKSLGEIWLEEAGGIAGT
jgi:hypothetical protein